jgi:hypothetical protein
MTVADKLRIKQRRAPRAKARLCRRRMGRAHDPSGLCRRRLGLRCHPQHKAGDARGLRGKRQFAARREIEMSRLAPYFQHDGTERIAGQRIGGRPQRTVHIGCAHRHEKPRIETELGKSAHRHRARFNLGEILPYPQQWPDARRPARESCDKTGRRSALAAGFCKHFVDGCQSEPALQRRVGIRMAERHLSGRTGLSMRLDTLDIAAQSRKRAHPCALSHRRSLEVLDHVRFLVRR